MSPPKRKSSWSFSLRDDDLSDSSQEELAQPQPFVRQSEAEQLIAEAEEEPAAQDPEPELFDISLVEEGDVRFVETPFTIARRVAATKKRSRKEDEDVQEQPSPQPLPAAPLPKAKKSKLAATSGTTKPRRKSSKPPPIADNDSGAHSTSKLSSPKPASIASGSHCTTEAQQSDHDVETSSPQPPLVTANERRKPAPPTCSSPKTSRFTDAPPATTGKTAHLAQAELNSRFPSPSNCAPFVRGDGKLDEAGLNHDDGASSVLDSEASLWGADWDTASSIIETMPCSPPPRSPPPLRSPAPVSVTNSNSRPRYQSNMNSGLETSPSKTYSVASSPALKPKSKRSPPEVIEEIRIPISTDSNLPIEAEASSSVPQTPSRRLKPTFEPLIPRPDPRPPPSAQKEPSTPQRSRAYKLPDLSPPTAASPRYSRPIASSPSRARPASTPPRPSAAPTSNAHWSTLSSRARPSLVPTPSAYGSALDGISSTSAVATRFALPEFAPQGGGISIRPSAGGGRSKMSFKPAESLGAFKARMEKEKNEQQQRGRRVQEEREVVAEEAQERILLGANLRSVKPGTVVSVETSTSKERGEKSSVYRDFDW